MCCLHGALRDLIKENKMKNVLIISSTPRKGGNSDVLCDEFAKGAKESGNKVTKIRIADKFM